MTKKATTKLVTERKLDGGGVEYDFRCPYTDQCPVPGVEPFSSIGWVDREVAVARGKQHINWHETGEEMPELHEFRVARNLTPDTAGAAVKPEDWEF